MPEQDVIVIGAGIAGLSAVAPLAKAGKIVIIIRKLAAVDMAWLGARLILAEYALGILLPIALGLISIRAGYFRPVRTPWQIGLGIWLVCIGINYVPLFIYAVLIALGGSVKEEGQPEIAHARKYSVQQTVILVPFLVVILAVVQEVQGRSADRP